MMCSILYHASSKQFRDVMNLEVLELETFSTIVYAVPFSLSLGLFVDIHIQVGAGFTYPTQSGKVVRGLMCRDDGWLVIAFRETLLEMEEN